MRSKQEDDPRAATLHSLSINVQNGEWLSETQYYRVTERINGSSHISVVNVHGKEMAIDRNIIDDCAFSSSQYSETKKVTRTEMSELLMRSGGTVFSVCFEKKLNEGRAADAILRDLLNRPLGEFDPVNFKKDVRDALKGEERVLVGYLAESESKMGRSLCIDLESDDASPRLVDHRTLKWLVLKGIKYVVK